MMPIWLGIILIVVAFGGGLCLGEEIGCDCDLDEDDDYEEYY